MVHSWPVAKGVKADLGIWDFFGIFRDFENPKNPNRELRNIHLNFFPYVGLMILRIS
jgi:hypothetical protein